MNKKTKRDIIAKKESNGRKCTHASKFSNREER
jgi:hypothetical protein